MKYVCSICGYIYDEAKEAIPFQELLSSWVCPLCGAAKSAFAPDQASTPVNTSSSPAFPVETIYPDEDMRQLSAGELSALCSNLARGCDKQYKEEEAGLFRQIADYFAAVTPPVPDADIAGLADLIRSDLGEGYPGLRSAAVEDADRGTQRICVWGEKVTNILNSLLQRWEREGDAFLQNTQVWVCSICGFVYVGDTAPDLCPVCKVPSWKFDKIEGRASL